MPGALRRPHPPSALLGLLLQQRWGTLAGMRGRVLGVLGVVLVAMACGSDDEPGGGNAGTGGGAGVSGSGAMGGSSGAGGNAAAGAGGSGASAGGAGGAAAGGAAGSGGGGAYANAGSSLGTNLSGVRDYSREWAFVDAFKMSRDWISGDSSGTWDDGRSVNLDADGWVQSLEAGQVARTLMFWGLDGRYPAGRYVVLYDGVGTLEYHGGAAKDAAASSAGREVLDVDPSAGGIGMNLTAVDTADPIRNIRVIMPGGVCDNDAYRWCDAANPCDAGAGCASFESNYENQRFHPIFLERIRRYSTLRFMDWMDTNNSEQSAWVDRPKPSDARWTTKGVPVEVMVDLANRLHADPWFTLPHLADDDYVSQFASAVRSGLSGDLTVYVEHSNEVWNGIFSQADYARQQGLAQNLSTNDYQAQLYYHSRRSVQIFDLFEAAFGGTDRLVRVMGSHAANSWASEQVLDFEAAAQKTDALGIAPYFGGSLGSPSEQSRVAAMSLDELFAEIDSVSVPTAVQRVVDSAAVASSRGVRLIAYEGGQHLAGNGGVENDATINALFDAANRDPRMGAAYATYLQGWKASGGELFVHFVNTSGYSKWGRWGALEYLRQPRNEAPKFDALMTFIESNTPWW